MNIVHRIQDLEYEVRSYLRGKHLEATLKPGAIYEDCGYHPMICIENNGGSLVGVSMIDGTRRCCTLDACGVIVMTYEEAWERKQNWEEFQTVLD